MTEHEKMIHLINLQAVIILQFAAMLQSRVSDLSEDELRMISFAKSAAEASIGESS